MGIDSLNTMTYKWNVRHAWRQSVIIRIMAIIGIVFSLLSISHASLDVVKTLPNIWPQESTKYSKKIGTTENTEHTDRTTPVNVAHEYDKDGSRWPSKAAFSSLSYGYDGLAGMSWLLDPASLVPDKYDYDAVGLLFVLNEDSRDPLGLHKYLYCQNDPVNGIDPSGHETLLSMVFAMGINTDVRVMKEASTVAAKKAATSDLYQFYLGIHLAGDPHAIVYVNNILTKSGSVYDIYPDAPVPTKTGAYNGTIRQRAFTLAAFQRYAPTNFKICKLNAIQYCSWRVTMQVIDAMDNDPTTWIPTQFSYYGFNKFFRPPYNCAMWAVKASAVAWFESFFGK